MRCVPALVVMVTASCSYFGGQATVEVLLPEPPAHWRAAFPDLTFELRVPDVEGRELSAVARMAGGASALVCVSKTGNTPILAFARGSRTGEALRPAGGIFPLDCGQDASSTTMRVTWESGPAASVLFRLAELGCDISLLNAARLRQFLCSRADPWDVDLNKIVERLAQGDFSAYDIDQLPARDVAVSLGVGEWFLETPFRTACQVGAGEVLTLKSVSLGTHTLFSVQGERIRLSVGERETTVGAPE